MPYIEQKARKEIEEGRKPQTAGELNYAITLMIYDYYKRIGRYQSVNDIVGALNCASMEIYRRVVAGYEDKKIAENGDVYGE
jgi:hypothetical protein